MIDLAIRRPVATSAVYIALFALGVYSFRLIPVEALPDLEYPRLNVYATWAGASPEATEAFVTAPLEAVIRQVGGVERIVSESRADRRGTGSSAVIQVEFERDARMEFARLEMSERINSVRDDLPEGVAIDIPQYLPPDLVLEAQDLLVYGLTGPYTSARLTEIAEREIAVALRGVSGVSDVGVRGGDERELLVELDRGRLEALGILPQGIARRISELSEPRSPGSVELDGTQYAIAVRTRALTVPDIEQMVVLARPGGPVRVRDLGQVRDQVADPRGLWRINGQPAISLSIARQSGTNVISVSDRVKAELERLVAVLPPGVQLRLERDESRNIREQLGKLRLRAMAAAIAIFIVLILFLRSLGAVLVVFATIGFSVLFAVNFLYFAGFTLNLLTLAGLAWGFGLVVDNGIVVLENVERHRRRGSPPGQAASRGARQVVVPVIASTLTTAAVLLPFLFLRGDLRIQYLPLSYAVGFSIVASLFVAFTFVPALAARVAARPGGRRVEPDSGAGHGRHAAGTSPRGQSAAESAALPSDPGRQPAYIRGYRALLGFGLGHPFLVALVCLASLGGSWRLFDTHVSKGTRWGGFFLGDRTRIAINIDFPRGAGLDRTDELARAFESQLAAFEEIERYESLVYANQAQITAYFPDEFDRTSIPEMVQDQIVAHATRFSGVDIDVFGSGPGFFSNNVSQTPTYSAQILGYNYLTVREIAEDMAARLERFTRVRDVNPNVSSSWQTRDREFEYYVEPDRAKLASSSLTVFDLLRYVSSNVQGTQDRGRARVGGEEIPFTAKVAGYRDFDFFDLTDLKVPVTTGEEVSLASVANIGQREVLAAIRREDQQYERTVAWEFRGPAKMGDLVRDAVVDAMDLPPGYKVEVRDQGRWTEDEAVQLWLALAAAILLIYLVTAGLFESLAAPFVVLFSLPFALTGVFLIFFYADASFTATAFIGTIMMGGIVVNNAILVVYHIGQLRKELPTREAILQGTLQRVRPILMTTVTTIFGLLPLVLFAESQDQYVWNALGLATIGGLISSTLFVLVAIPVAYRYIVARGA